MEWIKEKISKYSNLKKVISTIINLGKKIYMYTMNKLNGIDKNKVVFISFSGKSYSDNPRAISEKLNDNDPNSKIVWLFNNPDEKKLLIPDYVKCVRNNSLRALKELATAGVWVDNFTKPKYLYKSRKQLYIQTWHGDRGFKKILYDSSFITKEDKFIEEDICDLAVSGSEYGDMQYRSAFRYNGKILRKGYPRNDILLNENVDLSNEIRNKLGVDKSTNILLYAPTLRREAAKYSKKQNIGMINLNEIIDELERKYNKPWVCFFRAHSSVAGLSGLPHDKNKLIDVSSYEDMSELLLVSDMLITDYSSSAGDFALRKKPIILFQEDRQEYIKKDRTFYFDIDSSPYLIANNQEEVLSIIKKMEKELIEKNCDEILKFYGAEETGRASEYVAEYIISYKER